MLMPDYIPPMPTTTTIRVVPSTCTIPATSILTLNKVDNYITAWAPPEPITIEPKLDAIRCPGCGTGNVKKTNINGIVECTYCGRQFTLRY